MDIVKIKKAISERSGKDILVQREILEFLVEEAERAENLLTSLEKLTYENHTLKAQISSDKQITELQNLNDKLYKVVEILKRKQDNKELLTIQAELIEDIADEMRELLRNSFVDRLNYLTKTLE